MTEMNDTIEDRDTLLEQLEGVEIGESLPPSPKDESTQSGTEQPPEPKAAQNEPEPTQSEGETEATDPEKVESRYEKLRKDQLRQNKAWKKLEDEKAEFRKQQEALTEQQKKLETDKLDVAEKLAKPAEPQDPESLKRVAERFREEDEHELAEQAEQMARELSESKQNASKTVAEKDFREGWQKSLDQQVEKHPELKDPDSSLHKEVASLLKAKPVLTTYVGGFDDAVQVALMQQEIVNAKTLQEQNQKLEAELNQLKERTQLTASDAPAPAKPKSFDSLSHEEQREKIWNACLAADGN